MDSIFKNNKSKHTQVFILCETYEDYHKIIEEIEDELSSYLNFSNTGVSQLHFFRCNSKEQAIEDLLSNLAGNNNFLFINRLNKKTESIPEVEKEKNNFINYLFNNYESNRSK